MRMCRRMGMGFRSSFGEFLLFVCLGTIFVEDAWVVLVEFCFALDRISSSFILIVPTTLLTFISS